MAQTSGLHLESSSVGRHSANIQAESCADSGRVSLRCSEIPRTK
jgi:hypothetical protein